jgi:hypothetical protein
MANDEEIKPRLVGKREYRKPQDIKTHPELKDLYLIMRKDQDALTKSIAADGFLEDRPLTMFRLPDGEEYLGDGHTRLKSAIDNGIENVPVVVHDVETVQDAVALILGIDFRQRKRHETIHLIHVLEKIQPMVSSISDAAGKKPKGKLSAILGRWIGASQATVERLQSILKNPEAKAYFEAHKDEKLSILDIYKMFKEKKGDDVPPAEQDKGQEKPTIPPAEEKPKDCFGKHPEGINQKCIFCNDEAGCQAATPASSGQDETPPVEPTEQETNCHTFGAYDPETCIKECKDIEACKAKTASPSLVERPENEESTAPPVHQPASPEGSEEKDEDPEEDPEEENKAIVPLSLADVLKSLPVEIVEALRKSDLDAVFLRRKFKGAPLVAVQLPGWVRDWIINLSIEIHGLDKDIKWVAADFGNLSAPRPVVKQTLYRAKPEAPEVAQEETSDGGILDDGNVDVSELLRNIKIESTTVQLKYIGNDDLVDAGAGLKKPVMKSSAWAKIIKERYSSKEALEILEAVLHIFNGKVLTKTVLQPEQKTYWYPKAYE